MKVIEFLKAFDDKENIPVNISKIGKIGVLKWFIDKNCIDKQYLDLDIKSWSYETDINELYIIIDFNNKKE